MIPENEALARDMYDAYCEAVGGKAYNGEPLPNSSEFFADENKTKQANAWIVAADIALAWHEDV